MKSIEQVLVDWVHICEQVHIPYVVMGGIAVRVHGIPRPTYDVDLTIVAEKADLANLFDKAESCGYSIPDAYRKGWRDVVGGMPIVKVRTWLEEGRGVDVDLFIVESEFQKSLMKRRMTIELEATRIFVVTPEDLILLKLIANRPRDIGDITDVRFMQGNLDEPYMRYWANALDITERLEKALAEPI